MYTDQDGMRYRGLDRQDPASLSSIPNPALDDDAKSNRTTITKGSINHTLTILWHELDHWQRDNAHIQSSYRRSTNSFVTCFHSAFRLHNETVNIWSHALGSFFFFCYSVYFYWSYLPRHASLTSTPNHNYSEIDSKTRGIEEVTDLVTRTDALVFAAFFAGSVGCLGISATYHCISNHSHLVARWGNRMDYLGIVLLIWGSFIPSVYYGFVSTRPDLVTVYWSMISVLGVGCGIVSVDERFRTPDWRTFRAGMFVAMGLSAVVPVLHGLWLFGAADMRERIGLYWVVAMGVLYVAGAGLYAFRVPERFKPGAFDLVGSSHQIFHILVLLAAGSHLVGLLEAFEHEHQRRVMEMYG